MLDQDPEESLDGTEQCAMHHVGAFFLSVPVHEGHVETLGQVKIELYRGHLPFPSEGILDFEIDLRSVKRASPFINLVVEAFRLYRLLERFRRLGPGDVVTDTLVFRGTSGEIRLDIGKTEGLPHVQGESKHLKNFILDLIGGTENMGIILGKTPNPQ